MTHPMWWKVKVGSRWRGAVYEDESGQAWLCAAGYRREGEGSDFYKRFMALVPTRGANHYLPTQEDYDLLGREQEPAGSTADNDLFRQWEAQLVTWARTWLAEAVTTGVASMHVLDAADGNKLTRVEMVGSRDDRGTCDLYVEFHPLDFSAQPELEWAEQVFLCGICPSELVWQASFVGRGRGYSATDVELHWLNARRLVVDAEEVIGVPAPNQLAHYTHRERLLDCIVEGEATRALCGQWFVPRHDPQSREPCQLCTLIYERLPPGLDS